MNYDFADRDLLLGILGEVRDAVLITDARLDLPGPAIVRTIVVFRIRAGAIGAPSLSLVYLYLFIRI